jgi:hypothetical protein
VNDFLGLPAWAWVAAALAALAGVAWLVRGRYRQLRARRAIDNVISAVAYDELRDVLLPTGAGDEIHLHYLLLTERGLLVIDLFDVAGLIFAGEKMQQWSVFGTKRHFTFANPLPMLYDRVAAVRQLAGELPVEGRVVFSMQGARLGAHQGGCEAEPARALKQASPGEPETRCLLLRPPLPAVAAPRGRPARATRRQ